MADLGPGTMPRGKYPESPAPAGSHALISRTPTPGGMLHANPGLPRPPPRNFQLSRGQHTPDTGATPKEKTKTNPPRAISPEMARRRMTTPVVNTRPTPEQPPRKKQHRHSGISRASGLPRPYFQNADPGRHAPCQSRAATTSPSQLSTSPPATTSKTNPTAPPQCPSRAVASRQRSRNAGGMRRQAGMTPHWRECEAPLRRTQRDGADETIGRILSHSPWRRGKGGGADFFVNLLKNGF